MHWCLFGLLLLFGDLLVCCLLCLILAALELDGYTVLFGVC